MSIVTAPMSGRALKSEGGALTVIGIQCCRREITTPTGGHPAHAVVKKYVDAVVEGAGAMPLLVPAEGEAIMAQAAVTRIDGLLVPGSPSNIEPHHYDGAPSLPDTLHDPARDAVVLPLLRAAIEADLPVLAICRGIQELNVALGGTLHQQLHEVPGRLDHRAPKLECVEDRYSHRAHGIELTAGGLLETLAGKRFLSVNSLHHQGIDRLAPALAIEAVAPDGQIEAVRLPGARFVVGVQWHPEFRFAEDPFSVRLFSAFGAACRARATARAAA
ncbi:MAG TPA: gamma-glutamyl-gamma-aminobutyrate hydrolase family protein [Stellaceae bacterium]|nr:gamma-glutamyl-gamma-aminobutyrate hydrolase family protein [Stellaceae bacterium]